MTSDDQGYRDSATAYESSVEQARQLQPGDTLDQHGVDDILDEGIVTRERWSPAEKFGNTASEMRRGETLEQRIAQEEPDAAGDWDDLDDIDGEVGDVRSGRLVMSDDVHHDDRFAIDAGIDGAGASAEEAAVHVIPDDDPS
jgi:hypothetical protein